MSILTVMDISIGTAGGLGLFLFGMNLMSEGLKKVAGPELKKILGTMTRRRIMGFLVGVIVTAIIQSSSATTVMLVGFVNAGLLTLKQAIPVIIGTNIGTTITAWLVSMSGIEIKISFYALPSVVIGFIMQVFGRSKTVRNTGEILLGFGILFIGVGFMKDAFGGFEKSPAVQSLFIKTADTPILALLAGLAITLVIQSSSAAVASIQLLAAGGAFGQNWDVALNVAIPFILGSNIGTTITAQLASMQTNLNARRAAWAHTLFNVIGTCICFWMIGWFSKLFYWMAPWKLSAVTIAASIAIAHTSIKTFEAVFFLPLTGVLEKTVVWLIKGKPSEVESLPVTLEEHLLDTPEIAMDQVKREILRMAIASKDAVNYAIDGLTGGGPKKLELARKTEDLLDRFQYEITSYLAALSTKELSKELSTELPVMLHTVNDLERVGDHAVNIAEIAERKIEQKLTFSDSAMEEVSQLKSEANMMLNRIIKSLDENDIASAKAALENENTINRMQIDFRRSHVQRMSSGLCSANAGLIFIDLVDNVEKIGDHLTNIAQSVIGGLQWDGMEVKELDVSKKIAPEKPPVVNVG